MNYFTQFPKNNYGFIYKYTSPSNKSYIGQTIRSLKERAKNNKGEGYISSTVFFRAIQKYGFENFQIEILGEYPIEELNEKEQFFIKKYNTKIPNGYNIQDGGKIEYLKNNRTSKINQFDLNGNFIKQYDSIALAARENNTSPQAISAVVRKIRTHHNGYIYCYDTEDKPNPVTPKKTHGRLTAQYDLDGNLIKIYKSANQAGIALGKNGRNIRAVCEGKRQTAFGFKWKYLD